MYILGVTGPISYNNAAVLLKDGKLLAAVEEERLIGVKHSPRIPPINAVQYCLQYAGITFEDVDFVAVGFRSPFKYLLRSAKANLKRLVLRRLVLETGTFTDYFIRLWRFREELSRRYGRIDESKWRFIPHHMAHAASAYRVSGFERAAIITLDGQGEDDSGMIAMGDEREVLPLHKFDIHDSWGWFYTATTSLLGFTDHDGEGKTMALAAYGKPVISLKNYVRIPTAGGYSLPTGSQKRFFDALGPRRLPNTELTERHKDIASSLQSMTNQIGVTLATTLYEKTGLRQFCLGGGVALNCVMNGEILKLPFVDDIYVQPAANDAGTALGAAFELYSNLGYKTDFVMEHAFWGPEYSNDMIKSVLKECKLKYDKYDDIEGVTAELLNEGKIVGWFQGRLEWGPRALGSRSILAHPGIPGIKERVNNEVKHREPWRPFAPSLLKEAGPEYLENFYSSPFMILAFKVKEGKIKDISATCHVDGTTRPQTVTKDTNPMFYRLIKCFEEISSIPVVLNTSFNDRGRPIVNTPREAIRTFYSTGLDALAIGNYLVLKDNF